MSWNYSHRLYLLFTLSLIFSFKSFGQQTESIQSKNNSLTIMSSNLTGKWRLKEIRTRDSVINFPKNGVNQYIELNMTNFRKGRYLEYQSKPENEEIQFVTCQPIPSLKQLQNGQFSLTLTGLYGQSQPLINLVEDVLTFQYEDGQKYIYQKTND